MTAQELLHLPDDGVRHELVRGLLISRPLLGGQAGCAIAKLSSALYQSIHGRRLGHLFAATGFWLSSDPDTVLAPRIAFVSAGRLPGAPDDGFVPIAPDVAVEGLSPDDRQVDVEERIQQWLDAGTTAVWIVNPRRRTVTIHRAGADPRVLRESDALHGEDVVPGCELKVAEIFA